MSTPSPIFLDVFPPEIIAEFVGYLSGGSIERLFLIGSRVLCSKLLQRNTIATLQYCNLEALLLRNLTFASRCQGLKTLRILAPNFHRVSLPWMCVEEIEKLPTSLNTLELRSKDAYNALIRRRTPQTDNLKQKDYYGLPVHLSSIFPNLSTLKLVNGNTKRNATPTIPEGCEIQMFPDSLTHLVTPSPARPNFCLNQYRHLRTLVADRHSIDAETLAQLYHSPLRKLVVNTISVEHVDQLKFPDTLEHLEQMFEFGLFEWLHKVPSSVKTLVLPTLHCGSVEDMSSLRAQLTHLEIGSISIPLKHLPRSLTWFSFNIHTSIGLDLNGLPSLRTLHIHAVSNLSLDLKPLPPTLVELSIPTELYDDFSDLPQSLTSISLPSRVDDLTLLPSSLTILKAQKSGTVYFKLPIRLQDTTETSAAIPSFPEWTTVSNAAENGRIEVLEYIKSIGGQVSPSQHEKPNSAPLTLAIINNHPNVVKWLLNEGHHWSYARDKGKPLALVKAASSNCFELFLRIPSAFAKYRRLELIQEIIKSNNPDAIRALFEHGFKSDILASKPFSVAISGNSTWKPLFECLMNGIGGSIPTEELTAAIRLVVQKCPDIGTAVYLHDLGAEIDSLDSKGQTLAHLVAARASGALDWFKWLDSVGLDLSAFDSDEKSPEMICRDKKAKLYLKTWKAKR